MPEADKALLVAKRIVHVYLGDGFTRYCESRVNEPVEAHDL